MTFIVNVIMCVLILIFLICKMEFHKFFSAVVYYICSKGVQSVCQMGEVLKWLLKSVIHSFNIGHHKRKYVN